MEIIDFIRARIEEDELAARFARIAPLPIDIIDRGPRAGFAAVDVLGGGRPELVTHLARHTPERVMMECVAKRHLIDLIAVGLLEGPLARDILRAFAKAYSDHPDYATFAH